MKIEVNINKKYFFVLLGAILILGIVLFVQAYGTNNPPVLGHTVGEINWADTIPGNLLVQGLVSVAGQSALFSDANSIIVGDLAGGDGIRQLILRAGDQDRVTITSGGNVGIGTTNPLTSLHVVGDARADRLTLGSSSVRTLSYVSGNNVACPIGTTSFLRHYSQRSNCQSSCPLGFTNRILSCTVAEQWASSAPFCIFHCQDLDSGGNAIASFDSECFANQWTEAFCIG